VLKISWSADSRCSVVESVGGGRSAVESRIKHIFAVKRSRNICAENDCKFVDARPPLPRPKRLLKVVQSLFGFFDWWKTSASQYSHSLVRYEECSFLTKRTHDARSAGNRFLPNTLSRRRVYRRRDRQLKPRGVRTVACSYTAYWNEGIKKLRKRCLVFGEHLRR